MVIEPANADIVVSRRAELFHERYGDRVDAGRSLAGILTAAGNYISRIVGPEAADTGMAQIVDRSLPSADSRLVEARDWRAALEGAANYCFSEWPLGARLHDLAAYAEYGIVLHDSSDTGELAEHVESLLGEAEDFRAETPLAQWKLEDAGSDDLVRLLNLAQGRWALDNGKPIAPDALAALGGVSSGRIRNMMSGLKRTFSAENGLIPAHEALAWLGSRPEFWNSIWRDQQLTLPGSKQRPPIQQAVFVPVARDDSVFHPGLKRGAGYTIGAKGSETQVIDFDEALAAIQRMPVPYWRRPNESDNWGIVAGVRWERLDVSELEALAASRNPKIAKT